MVEERRALDRALLMNHALIGDPPAQLAARERALLEKLRRAPDGADGSAAHDPAWLDEVAKTEAAFAALEQGARGPVLRIRERKTRAARVEVIEPSPPAEES